MELSNVKLTSGTESDLSELGIQTHTAPRQPKHATYEGRLRTYQGWPEGLRQTPEMLADAGFYYVGKYFINIFEKRENKDKKEEEELKNYCYDFIKQESKIKLGVSTVTEVYVIGKQRMTLGRNMLDGFLDAGFYLLLEDKSLSNIV